MKDTLRRHVDINYLGQEDADQGQEQPLGGFPHPDIFLRWDADNRCRVNRTLTMSNGGYMHHREQLYRGVVTGVVTEWTFRHVLVGVDVAFDYNLCLRRDFQR